MITLTLKQLWEQKPQVCQIMYTKLGKKTASAPFVLDYDGSYYNGNTALIDIYRLLQKNFPNGDVQIVCADSTKPVVPPSIRYLLKQYITCEFEDVNHITVWKQSFSNDIDSLILEGERTLAIQLD